MTTKINMEIFVDEYKVHKMSNQHSTELNTHSGSNMQKFQFTTAIRAVEQNMLKLIKKMLELLKNFATYQRESLN